MQYLSIFSVFAPAILGLSVIKRIDSNSHWIVLLVILAAVPQLSALLVPEDDGTRNILYNLYIFFDATILASLFFLNSKIEAVRFFIAIMSTFQLIGYALYFAANGLEKEFVNEFVCLNSLFQVLWVLLYFYERYISDHFRIIEREPIFWFCMGILLYAPTTYFLFVFRKVIKLSTDPDVAQLWTLHHYLNISMYLLFTIGIGINLLRHPKQHHANK